MSVVRSRGQNGGHFYSNITQPVKIDLNFTVDSTNGNGLGVRSIKSNGYIQNVFMQTSASPGKGLGGLTNPNPHAGLIFVQFKNNFNYYLGGFSGFVSPLGSSSTATVQANGAVITSLGTASLAQWQAVGFPKGFTPAVGGAFVATSTATIGGGATVAPASQSGIMSMEVVGDPNQTIANSNIAVNAGAIVLLQCLNTSDNQTAPANGSTIGMSFFFDCSSVSIPDGGPSNSGTGGL